MLTRSGVVEQEASPYPQFLLFSGTAGRSLIKPADRSVTTGGRRAKLCLNSEANRLAVHGGARSTWAVVDLAGKVLHKEVVGAARFRGGMFVTHLRNTINAALKHCREQGFNLQGIGISFPGVVDQENRITLAPNIGGEGVVLADLVEDGVGLPVHIDNDARLGALAEIWWRASQPEQTIAFLMVDYGVGVGLAMDGRVHAGRTSRETSATLWWTRGERCACGQFGCLETFISYFALVRRINDQIRLGRPTVLPMQGPRNRRWSP